MEGEHSELWFETYTYTVCFKLLHTAKRILERLGIQTSSSFGKRSRFVNLRTRHLYGLVFYPETIGVS